MTTTTLRCTLKKLEGCIDLPSSKSISNRLLMIRAISRQDFRIERLSDAGDTVLLDNLLIRISTHHPSADPLVLDTGNAGTVLRFLTAFLSILPGRWVLIGSDRMKERPIQPLVDALTSLGADIRYTGETGYPPVIIQGGCIRGGDVTVESSMSSQFMSALLLIAPSLPGGLTLHLTGETASRSYIKMTVRLMQQYGIRVDTIPDAIRVFPGRYNDLSAVVETDWSSASFWYEAVALAEEARLLLPGLHRDSLQGDAEAIDLFGLLGVTTTFTEKGAVIRRVPAGSSSGKWSAGNPFQDSRLPLITFPESVVFDFLSSPDLAVPALIAWGFSGNPGTFTGLQNLAVKESNRYTALLEAFHIAGIPVRSSGEQSTLTFPGFNPAMLKKSPHLLLNTHDDHRLAMAFAMLTIPLGSISVTHPGSVAKSYPRFWEQLDTLLR